MTELLVMLAVTLCGIADALNRVGRERRTAPWRKETCVTKLNKVGPLKFVVCAILWYPLVTITFLIMLVEEITNWAIRALDMNRFASVLLDDEDDE